MRLHARKVLALLAAALVAGTTAACDDDGTGSSDLTPPLGVTATPLSTTGIRVTWNQVPDATGYEVQRAAGAAAFAQVGTAQGTFFEDGGLTPNTQYRYRVRAVAGNRTSEFSSEAAATTGQEGPRVAVLAGRISANRVLHADTTYVLQGYVKVDNAAVLTIQPGTRIVGSTEEQYRGSSLWILRGSRIVAEGTAERPIVFTSGRPEGQRKPGDWGGLVIIGNAPINRTANPILTEGPVGTSENYAGGTDLDDDSGSLRYVRVEFAGYDVSNGSGQELNGISMYGVGRGTKLEYVQVMSGLDDSFEWWGGAPDGRYLVSYLSGDDHFDFTEGYRGRNQFLIAYQDAVLQPAAGTGTLSSDPRGMEGDGCEADKPGCTYANAPYTSPVFANFTLVGPGPNVYASTDGNGMVIRRGAGGTFVNGVVARWPGVGVSLRDAESKALFDADSLVVRNLVLVDNGSDFEAANRNFGAVIADARYNNRTAAGAATIFAGLPAAGTVPTAAGLDFRPAAGSAPATAGTTTFPAVVAGRVGNFFGGQMPATAYAGAAAPGGTKWWEGWTNYARD